MPKLIAAGMVLVANAALLCAAGEFVPCIRPSCPGVSEFLKIFTEQVYI